MKVVIVEDDMVAAAQFKNYLERYGNESDVELEVTHFTDAETFLKNYKKESFYLWKKKC